MNECNKSPPICYAYLSAKWSDECAKCRVAVSGAFVIVKTATHFVIPWQPKSMFDNEEPHKKKRYRLSRFCYHYETPPVGEVTLKNAPSQTRRSGGVNRCAKYVNFGHTLKQQRPTEV